MANDRCRRPNAERRPGSFELRLVILRYIWRGLRIEQEASALQPWCHLLQDLQPLRRHRWKEICESSGISTWTRQGLDEAASDRIGDGGKYDRHRAAPLLQGCYRHRAERKNRVRLHGQQLTGIGPISFGIACGPALVKP